MEGKAELIICKYAHTTTRLLSECLTRHMHKKRNKLVKNDAGIRTGSYDRSECIQHLINFKRCPMASTTHGKMPA